MIELHTLWLFTLASAAIVIVPGPSVTLIIANSLRDGTRAGLMNVSGTQAGLLTMIAVLAMGFSTVVASLAWLFDIIRVIGALYLIWLGCKLWSSKGASGTQEHSAELGKKSMHQFFWQGFLVIWSNPKALFFFGAFIPQFVDQTAPVTPQVVLLGMIFMVVASVLDSTYAVLAGRTGTLIVGNRLQVLERLSGTCLIGGGLWMLTRRST